MTTSPNTLPGWLRLRDTGVTLTLRVKPGARQTAITHIEETYLMLTLNASATEGKANEALLKFLANFLKIKRNQLQLLMGPHHQNKVVWIQNISAEVVIRAICHQHLPSL